MECKGFELSIIQEDDKFSEIENMINQASAHPVVFNQVVPVEKEVKFTAEHAKLSALARFDLLQSWHKFRNREDNKKQADRLFLELYNSGELHKKIFGILGTISIGTIYRWNKTCEVFKSTDALIPKYQYSSSKEYRTSLEPEMVEVLLKFLLHPNKFLISKAINFTIKTLEHKGFEDIPSPHAFRRYANNYKKYNYDKWTLMRDGEKALKDRVEQYITRDISKLEVGDVLVADGHKLSFQVINPFTGKPTRATLVGFFDWKSGALVGYEIMLEENTQCIASAIRMAILNLGIVPKIVYQDNGKAFRAKYFQSCDFDEAGFNGVYQNLGIKPIFAKPYNARAKVIERFFLELQEEFEKLMPSYTGTSIAQKPAWMMRNEKLHLKLHKNNEFIPTIEQTIKLLECWLDYHPSKPCSNDKNRTIKGVLNSAERQIIDKNRLDDLMLKTDLKTIGRNGIRFLHQDYYNEALYGIRDKVFIRYSLFDLTKVKVYSIKGEFICKAKRVEGTHPMAYHLGGVKDMEDFKQKIQKQKRMKNKTIKSVKKYLPDGSCGKSPLKT